MKNDTNTHSDSWERIQHRAYFKWIERGRDGGGELGDWCAAEQEEAVHFQRAAEGQSAAARPISRVEAERVLRQEEDVRAHARMERIDPE